MVRKLKQKGGLGLHSILVKTIAMLCVVGAAVVLPLVIMNAATTKTVTNMGITQQTQALSEFVAAQSTDSFTFNLGETLVGDFTRLGESLGASFHGAAAVTADGNFLSVYGESIEGIDDLAKSAIEQGEMASARNGFAVAWPVKTAPNAEPIGAIVMELTDTNMVETIVQRNILTLGVAGIVFLFGVGGLALVVHRMTISPLHRVNTSVDLVAKGDYSSEIPGKHRKDEIGVVAASLDGFREKLAAGAALARESSFKSAAFEASSAALMMVDESFNVIAANPSVASLLHSNHTHFPNAGTFDPMALVETNLASVHPDGEGFVERVRAEESGGSSVLALGDKRFTIIFGPVADADGNTIGYVLEWEDATETFLTRGILDAIRDGQITAQISMSGTLLEMNDNFARLLGKTDGEPLETECSAVSSDLADAVKLLAETGHPQTGQFKLCDTDGNEKTVDGSLSIVRDVGGEPVRMVLIANDVTDNVTKLEQSAAERARIEAALAKVVEALRGGLESLSNGDLTIQIDETFDSEYEGLRLDFNNAMERLREAIDRVVENTDLINSESSEISNAADDLAARTERQASTLEETATALDQLTSSVKSAANGASRASRMVSDAKANAENSGRIVGEAVNAMGEIEASSEQISKITSLIDDIAFQTNLLALNAGVEAARAGGAGRGFAVVASEVRALAQRSSDAAREINGLISSSGAQVKRGVELVGQAGEALRGIVASVTEIATHVDEIATSAEQQSVGLGEINVSVNQLDQVTQQNAAMFEETTAASHALGREVETLKAITGSFNTGRGQKDTSNVVTPDFDTSPTISPANPLEERKAVNESPVVDNTLNEDGWEDF